MNQALKNIFRLAYSYLARPEFILRKANLLELSVEGELLEQKPRPSIIQRYLAKPASSFFDLVFAMKEAENDPHIRACLLKISESSLGWGRAGELRDAVSRLRASGKRVVAFLSGTDSLEYYLASACEEIIMPPSQSLNLLGLYSEVLYFKGALDKLSVKPELFHIGKYKSAVEPYTRESMSAEHREALDAILDDIYEELVSAVSASRGLSPERVKELIDQAPHLPKEALEHGLVDKVIYADQLDEHLEKMLGEPVRRINAELYYRLRRLRLAGSSPFRRAPRLALIYAAGVIEQGEDRDYQDLEESVTPERMAEALRSVRDNPWVKAAVLRVDSPGGSAVASDLIWRELALLRRAKPLIVSMGDVAASGGYYLAMPGEKILAQSCTLTGSIGVIAGKFNLRGLYNKFGLNKDQVKRGRHADLYSDYTDFSGSKREKISREIEEFYRSFVQKAAEARKMSFQELDSKAQGRVWTGKQAVKLGLVDELGGLRKAIDLAKQAIGLRPEDRAVLEIHPRPKRRLFPVFPFRIPFLPFLDEDDTRFLFRLTKLARERLLLIMPFLFRLK